MIDIINVTKSFGGEDIIKNASLRINRDERAGVVGPNGSGKTTLFSLITGEILPDSGSALLPSNIRTGYLRQHLSDYGLESNIVDFTADAVEGLAETHNRIVELEKKLAESPGESALRELGRLQTRYEALGAYSMRNRAEAALTGLGFKPADLARPLGSFSGGWRMRAALARTLIAAPDILLLDEPSNYLDLPAVEWLKRFLSAFDGTMLLISHDRYLLRSLTSVTVEVNAGVITRYQGNYDYYMEERARRAGIAAAAKKNQDKKKGPPAEKH
jgi:ATP-binding cassette subfamily F protein 3